MWFQVDRASVGRFWFIRFQQIAVCVFALMFGMSSVEAQIDFESDPINYDSAIATGRVAELRAKIESGETTLSYDADHGYLKSVLEHLNVPESSQMLVFSKTSFQLRRITSQRPRAVYFNDDVYVGWVQGGDVVEISSADPQLGAVFLYDSSGRSRAAESDSRSGPVHCLPCVF